MKILFLILSFCILASCDAMFEHKSTDSNIERFMESLKVVVDKRFDPPLCFLANHYYSYNGGPALTTIPCVNAERFPDKVVVGCESCWKR